MACCDLRRITRRWRSRRKPVGVLDADLPVLERPATPPGPATRSFALAFTFQYDRKPCAEGVSGFMKQVDCCLHWRAKRRCDLASLSQPFTGAVAAMQRTDSALARSRARQRYDYEHDYIPEAGIWAAGVTFHANATEPRPCRAQAARRSLRYNPLPGALGEATPAAEHGIRAEASRAERGRGGQHPLTSARRSA